MTSLRRLCFVCGGLTVLLLLVVDQGLGQEDATRQTKLRVLVPQSRSRVLVNGKTMPGKAAEVREFAAPALADGKKEYEVIVTWRTNDYTRFFRSAKVGPKPGTTVVVDLRKPDPKNPDRIEIRYVPTPDDVVARMCKLASIGKDDVVYDLGCGDGRMIITAVTDFKARSGVGIDLDPERVRESIENAKKRGVSDKIEIRQGDVLKIKDLSRASVVMLYMGDDVNLRLRPILQKTLKPGSRIVSHRFGMGDWKPDKTETFDGADGDEYTIHLWTIKK
jgi:precorrin-6B methylase 2